MAAAPPPDPSAGLFETLLVVDGRPVELDAHLRRLASSLELLGSPPPPADLPSIAFARCRGLALGRLRLTVAPHGGGMRAAAHAEPVEAGLVFPAWDRGAELRPLPLDRGLGPFKWADRKALDRASRSLGERELPLIVDRERRVLEASRANVFAVAKGVLFTPPADGRILPGIARARTIEAAVGAAVEVREAGLTVDELRAADEVFLTGSVRGVEPARSIAGAPLPRPGAVSATVARALRDRWLRDVRVLQPS